MDKQFIPVNTPLFSGNEEKFLVECIRTGWISSEGPYIKRFEEKFANYIGRKEGIAVANGSGALDIAIQALNIGKGDEVIVPTFTIISPVQSIVRAGATPVLVDNEQYTWNMDVTQVETKITTKTKAILIVHIYGLPVDMDPILELCEKYKLLLIEDAAEMHGQTYNKKMCGSFGDISTFSFYPNKHITTGEGGMIMVDKSELAERCRRLRNLAFENKGRRFIHQEMGWNYRMTNMQAAVGLAQLEKIESHIVKKRWLGKIYNECFKDLQNFQLPLSSTTYAENIYWVYGLVAATEDLCSRAISILNSFGISTRPFFWCMHEQPVFKTRGLFIGNSHPVAEMHSRNGFYLPSGLGITEGEVKYIAEIVNNL